PNPEHFEEGHTTGSTGKKPRHDQFNYMEQRRDLNLQYLLRMAGLPYDSLETYPVNARVSKNGHIYFSLENNNKGNDPISSGKWKHEDDDKFPVGTIVINASDIRNPSTYKGFGVWAMIEAQTTINMTTKLDNNLGKVTGDNNKAVPLPQHKHSIDIEDFDLGSKYTSENGEHNHSYGDNLLDSSTIGNGYAANPSGFVQVDYPRVTSPSGKHQHSIELGPHSHSANIENSGVVDASLNVQGKVINVMGWIRTG
ncbi:phage baseplate protein, partial [Vibrio lentus]|nr:hypothetical protein [Vibrio lentus]